MRFRRPIPITAGGVAIGSIDAELLEAVVNLATGGPVDGDGVPLSTEDLLERIRRRLEADCPQSQSPSDRA